MAHAELADFGQAVAWQQAALDAAERAGRAEELPWVEERLNMYRANRPCRAVWAEGEAEAQSAGLAVTSPG